MARVSVPRLRALRFHRPPFGQLNHDWWQAAMAGAENLKSYHGALYIDHRLSVPRGDPSHIFYYLASTKGNETN